MYLAREVNVSCSGGKYILLKDVCSLCIISICNFTFSYFPSGFEGMLLFLDHCLLFLGVSLRKTGLF